MALEMLLYSFPYPASYQFRVRGIHEFQIIKSDDQVRRLILD